MLRIVPLELEEANALVSRLHRHHKPAQGHKFSIGCLDTCRREVVGAAMVGRPVARMVNSRTTLEVVRLVTDGTPHACSMLYAAAARTGRELGYSKIQTYILQSETGVSLKAAGWTEESNNCGGGQWVHTDGKPRRTDQPTEAKRRWAKVLNDVPPTYKALKETAAKSEAFDFGE